MPISRASRAGEMKRRRDLVAAAMAEAGADHLVFCGYNRAGSAVQVADALAGDQRGARRRFTPGLPDALFCAIRQSRAAGAAVCGSCRDRRMGRRVLDPQGDRGAGKRGAKSGRVAVIGQMPFEQHGALAEKFGKIVSLNRVYQRLRAVKSAEELDLAARRRRDERRRDGVRCATRSSRASPSGNWATPSSAPMCPMAAPPTSTTSAPPRCTIRRSACRGSTRRTARCRRAMWWSPEITALFFDHGGQVLRSFTVGEEPTPLYRDLHAAADAALDAIFKVLKAGTTPAQVIAASNVIEDAGFSIIDDLVHGYGGGYLRPISDRRAVRQGLCPRSRSRPGRPSWCSPMW